MTGANFEVGNPVVESSDRDGALKKVPEMVVSIISDFNTAIVGEHIYILSPEFTQKLTGLVNNGHHVYRVCKMCLPISHNYILFILADKSDKLKRVIGLARLTDYL